MHTESIVKCHFTLQTILILNCTTLTILIDTLKNTHISTMLRSLPSVDALLSDGGLIELSDEFSRASVALLVRRKLDETRHAIIAGTYGAESVDATELVNDIIFGANEAWSTSPSMVINASGVILHTNLGRAPLSSEAAEAARHAAIGYSDLELDLKTGARGSRHSHVSSLLSSATGAENGMAVNNNAGATLLVLSALAGHGGEVIVSRGEAVEIGGGFRVPDVMMQSGAKLIEVGTVNRTYARDYEDAIGADTIAILKVHRSNFTVSGFTHEPSLLELGAVAAKRDVLFLHDLGSGCLLDTSMFKIEKEPTVQDSLSQGADLVMFSGDKLLGGPQAGIVVGKGALVDRISSHPLARALRIDKMTLAALNATLRSYIRGDALTEIPIWRMVSTSDSEIKRRAHVWQNMVDGEVVKGETVIGGGSAPGQVLPSWRLAIGAPMGAAKLARWMRKRAVPVVGRIEDDAFHLDPRTVLPEDDEHVINALREYSGR